MPLLPHPKTACSPPSRPSADPVWPGAGHGAGGWHPLLVRHPLRSRTHRRGPLDIPPRACPLADGAGLHRSRPGSVSVHQLSPRHRGLSDAGHLFRAGGKKAARPRLSPWQRLFRLTAGAARQRTCAGHWLRLRGPQLPAGAVRLELPARPHRRFRRRRKLCPAGHPPGAGLGEGEHPPLRR